MVDKRRKFAFTARLAGFRAALTDRSAATPLSSDGVRPEKTSGQKREADCSSDICAAKTPSTVATIFSLTARAISVLQGLPLLASMAIKGIRIITTSGDSIKSAPMPAALRLFLLIFLM
ncbi:MAG: hypothetical protein J0I79_27295 [Mesorhizobium sp.]|uniref:hypothetical protein n=1 Tax=Mesorhizobium sp. TaxID=1871066 RepID=UPI001ACBCBC1|nr:hypothetical protein [Mesorhizobium sp.]MBN9221666.1 hypothetical protein [Mesorhizobium sp.]